MTHKSFYTVCLILLTLLPIAAQSQEEEKITPCQPCTELLNLRLPDVRISQSEARAKPVPHCRLSGTIGKEIKFELVLPEAWNTRFSMTGNGGFAGAIHIRRSHLRQGYASAATDTGHRGASLDASWALNEPERQLNFGHLAVHRTAVTAKAIVRHYYCREPAYSYFVGCSRGGGQGMMEAQRYPEDFDGILAGAPAFTWPAAAADYIQNCRAIFPDTAAFRQPLLPAASLELLQSLVLAQCDTLDGLRDGILNDPRECKLDFGQFPLCPENGPAEDCFTRQQLNAIQTVYAGVSDGQREIYPGFPPGGENEEGGWRSWATGPSLPDIEGGAPSRYFALGNGIFKYLVFNDPDWDFRSYDFEGYFPDTRYAAAYLDATSTDYSEFTSRGGKMILYHGWNDPALSALATLEHYEQALRENPKLAEHIRLFLLPGVLHCSGGPGPSRTDWLSLLRDWVEKGIAPEKVVVAKWEKGETIMERPIYPYPDKAVYDGKGDPALESSFKREKGRLSRRE